MTIHCPNCSYDGKPQTFMKGSWVMELLLWILFFPIGLIYTIYRSTSAHKGCPKCGYQYVVKQ